MNMCMFNIKDGYLGEPSSSPFQPHLNLSARDLSSRVVISFLVTLIFQNYHHDDTSPAGPGDQHIVVCNLTSARIPTWLGITRALRVHLIQECISPFELGAPVR